MFRLRFPLTSINGDPILMGMTNATIYLRVSTSEQALEGVSLEAQEAKARAWAGVNGFSVSGVHTDAGLSGKRADNRPALQAALDEVTRNRGALIVYSLSRLARSTKDAITIAERLEKAGADLVSLSEKIDTTSAAGKMVFRMLAVLAEFERDLVSERTKGAMAHMKLQGLCVGSVPYGFKLAEDGAHLVADDAEAAMVADIRTMRAAGLTWQAIADAMNARGATTKKGKAWTWRTAQAAA